MLKKLVKFVGVLVVFAIVGVAIGVLSIDSLIKRAIEHASTLALGVPTTVATADLGLLSGRLAMEGLNVANPEGFDSPHFLRLDDGNVEVSLGSLSGQTVRVPELHLAGLDMNLQAAGGTANYKVILESLERLQSGSASGPTPGDAGKGYVIDDLLLRNIAVHVDLLPQGGQLTRLDVPIDEIRLTGVGSDTDHGVLLSELSGILIKALLTAVLDKGGHLLPADFTGDLTGQLDRLKSLGGDQIKVVTEEFSGTIDSTVDDVKGQIDDAAGNALDDLGGLFGEDDE